jgi:pyruvate dehydrogenase complex dehydrogenase (E1) component
VIGGSGWVVLLARDKEGVLRQRIEDCVDERMSCY